MDALCFSVTNYCNFVIEKHESYFFVRVLLLDFLNLRLNGAQNALLSGDESFIFVMSPWKEVELSLVPRLHELLKHIYFFLREPEFQVDFTCDFACRVHAPRNVDAKDHGRVVVGFALFQRTFEHVDNVLFDRDFLLLDKQGVRVVAELA